MTYGYTPAQLYLVRITNAIWMVTAGATRPLSGQMIFTSDFEALEWAKAYVSTWTDRVTLTPVDTGYNPIELDIDQR